MPNNKKNFKKPKLLNRVKLIVGDNTIQLEKNINRFYEESMGNFVGAPHMQLCPPANDGSHVVLMAGVEYTVRPVEADEVKKPKLLNRVKFIVGENTIQLEKNINRFYEESMGNFIGAPRMQLCPPANDGSRVVLMAGIEYTVRPVGADEDETEAEAEEEQKK